MSNTQAITLTVPDVRCACCVHNIKNALDALPGVEEVHTDIPTQTVRIQYDATTVSPQQMEAALSSAGYPISR
ncbi:MAG: heavy-metal-associated domain-containing protein [Ktedonobacteraceae bacterium]|nr:heavy-metal-associated domain-containing protein [Ktedonobacteraceae bacterium]